jgi:hypothetical protein
MKYVIVTREGNQSRPIDDYLKAYKYALFNRCILLQKNRSGVTVEINNFSNL